MAAGHVPVPFFPLKALAIYKENTMRNIFLINRYLKKYTHAVKGGDQVKSIKLSYGTFAFLLCGLLLTVAVFGIVVLPW